MFKKIASAISLWAILGSVIVTPTFAAPAGANVAESIIQGFTLNVANSTPQAFNPSVGQTLQPTITYDNAKATVLAGSNGYVKVIQGTTIIKTLATWNVKAPTPSPVWDGKAVDATGQTVCGNAGAVCPNGDYQIETEVEYVSGTDVHFDKQTKNFTIVSVPPAIVISAFNIAPTTGAINGTFDPSKGGANQLLQIDYTLNQLVDSVQLDIKSSTGKVMKTSTSTLIKDTFQWDGLFNSKLVPADTYTFVLTAKKSGTTDVSTSKTFIVVYNSANKGAINNFAVSTSSFDPNVEDAIITFTNTVDSNLTVEIQNTTDGGEIRTFAGYQDTDYGPNTNVSVDWDGRNDSGNSVNIGQYVVVVTARNLYGALQVSKNITVNSTGGFISNENAQISGVSFSPSSTFDPAKNDQLKIKFNIKQKLDSLKVYAVRGAEKIELLNESNVDKESNVETDWDGKDTSDEYVDAGLWRIQFESKIGSINLTAVKNINVTYNKPQLDFLYLSKTKFDQEQNEFTYVIFRTDVDANVTIQVLQDGSQQDNVVEDMDVVGKQWYAVPWDGSGYSYDDNLSIKVLAENTANHNIFDSKKISVDLAEDSVSGSKSNITQDYFDPALTNGNQSMELHYNLSDAAKVEVTVYKGTSSSNAVVATLLKSTNQESGDHSIDWNVRDDKGNKLSAGQYTYKIVSTTSISDTETGLFVIGNVGDAGNPVISNSDSSSTKNTSGNSTNKNVIVDGKDTTVTKTTDTNCAGFTDVTTNNKYCPAIKWVKDAGIFTGYTNNTFGVNNSIHRDEVLKVSLKSLGIKVPEKASGNLGYSDVDVNEWYMPYLQVGKERGIMTGDGGKTTVRPNDYVRRGEVFKVLFESLKSMGLVGKMTANCTLKYKDVDQVEWYRPYLCESESLLSADGLEVYTGTSFGGTIYATRGEVAQLLYALHLVNLI